MEEQLLNSSINLLSSSFRKAWRLFNNLKYSKSQIYHELMKTNYFTSKQVDSIIIEVTTEHNKLKELTKTQIVQLNSKIKNISKFVEKSQKQIEKNNHFITQLKTNLSKSKSKANYYTEINKLVISNQNKSLLLFNKQKKLTRLTNKINILQKRVKTNTFKLCFGSSDLLRQRPGHHTDKHRLNQQQKPYSTIEDWKAAWDLSRNNCWFSVGSKDKPQGNAEIQYYPASEKLRVRLPDCIALQRMEDLSVQKNIPMVELLKNIKYSTYRMDCRFIEINQVEFNHRFKPQLLSALANKQPVTAKILKKKVKDTIGYYLQLSFTEQTVELIKPCNYTKQVLGVDLNQKGLAYTVVKADGNRLVKDKKPVNGFISWELENKSTYQRKAIISETLEQVLIIAKENKITEIAIENLDFNNITANMNSGYKNNSKINEIISQFAKTQFKELLTRKCQRLGYTVNLVNSVFSSVGGFVKYGLINKVPVDIAASHWLARQALFGTCYKTENNINYIKKYEEAITFPYRIKPKQSNKLDNLSLKWKDLALALGKDRRLWVGKTYDLLDKLNVVLPEQEEEFNLFPDL